LFEATGSSTGLLPNYFVRFAMAALRA
jgi:hypothetical protein